MKRKLILLTLGLLCLFRFSPALAQQAAPTADSGAYAMISREDLLGEDGLIHTDAATARLISALGGADAQGRITAESLSRVTTISVKLQKAQSYDLSFLQFCPGLRGLYISGATARLTGLEALGGLKELSLLSLVCQPLERIDFVAGLTALQTFSVPLAENAELAPLLSCSQLSYLSVSGKAKGLESLTALKKLESFVCTDGEEAALRPFLDGCRSLKKIYLLRCSFTDLTFLNKQKGLQSLTLKKCVFESLNGFQASKDALLILDGETLESPEALNGLTGFKKLQLENAQWKGEAEALRLPGLESLSLRGCKLESYKVFGALSGLRELEITDAESPVMLADFAASGKLETLTLNKCPKTDFSGLTSAKSLKRLSYTQSQAADLTFLKLLPKLQELTLSGNPIKNVDAVAKLSRLESLDLEDTLLRSASALAKCAKLKKLVLPSWTDAAWLTQRLGEALQIEKKDTDSQLQSQEAYRAKLAQKAAAQAQADWQTAYEQAVAGGLVQSEAALLNAQGQAVGIDSALADAFARSLSLSGEEPLKGADLAKVQTLVIKGTGAVDASAVRLCAQVESVTMVGCTLQSALPLGGLSHLKELRLIGVSQEELCVLGTLPALESLTLESDQITDVSVLAACKNLRSLTLRGCPVETLTPLSALGNLRKLTLDGVAAVKLPYLDWLDDLTLLDTKGMSLSEIRKIPGCGFLQLDGSLKNYAYLPLREEGGTLSLSELKEEDLSVLLKVRGKTATKLILRNMTLSAAWLRELGGQLEALQMEKMVFTDRLSFEKLKNLKSLQMNEVQLLTKSRVLVSPGLERLETRKVTNLDWKQIKKCSKLTALVVQDSGLTNVTPLASLKKLETLVVQGQPGASGWEKLKELSALNSLTVSQDTAAEETLKGIFSSQVKITVIQSK